MKKSTQTPNFHNFFKKENGKQLAVFSFFIFFLVKLLYNKEAINSSLLPSDKYPGAISSAVLQPTAPSWFKRYAALAYATKTEAVNSALESSFKEYSTTC